MFFLSGITIVIGVTEPGTSAVTTFTHTRTHTHTHTSYGSARRERWILKNEMSKNALRKQAFLLLLILSSRADLSGANAASTPRLLTDVEWASLIAALIPLSPPARRLRAGVGTAVGPTSAGRWRGPRREERPRGERCCCCFFYGS